MRWELTPLTLLATLLLAAAESNEDMTGLSCVAPADGSERTATAIWSPGKIWPP